MNMLELFTRIGGWGVIITICALVGVYLCGKYNTKYLNYKVRLTGFQFAMKTFIGGVGIYFSIFLLHRLFLPTNEGSLVYYIIISILGIASLVQLFVAGMGRLVDIGKLSPWSYPVYFIVWGTVIHYFKELYPIYLLVMALLFSFPEKSED